MPREPRVSSPRPRPRTVVILDTREPVDVRLALSAVLDEEPERVALHEADILLVDPDGCLVGIERKTVSDFLASLGDGRLASQLTRMKAVYGTQGLILEGSYAIDGQGYLTVGIGTRWTHAAMQMTLWSLQIHFPDLVIWWTVSLGGTADVIRALANRGKTKGCFKKTSLLAVTPGEGGGKALHGTTPRARTARRVRPRVSV